MHFGNNKHCVGLGIVGTIEGYVHTNDENMRESMTDDKRGKSILHRSLETALQTMDLELK
jgi:hypothetical protein